MFLVFETPMGEDHVYYGEYESAQACYEAAEEFKVNPKIRTNTRISLEKFVDVYCLDEVVGQ